MVGRYTGWWWCLLPASFPIMIKTDPPVDLLLARETGCVPLPNKSLTSQICCCLPRSSPSHFDGGNSTLRRRGVGPRTTKSTTKWWNQSPTLWSPSLVMRRGVSRQDKGQFNLKIFSFRGGSMWFITAWPWVSWLLRETFEWESSCAGENASRVVKTVIPGIESFFSQVMAPLKLSNLK